MKYAAISEKFDHFSKREKVLVAATSIVLLSALIYTLFIEGLAAKVESANQQLNRAKQVQVKIEQQLALTQQNLQLDAKEAIQIKIKERQEQLQSLKDGLEKNNLEVVSTQQLSRFNQQITTADSRLKFLSFELDTQSYQQEDEAEEVRLAKCVTRFQVQGDNKQLLDYLAFIEKQPITIYWETFEFQELKQQQAQLNVGFYLLCAN